MPHLEYLPTGVRDSQLQYMQLAFEVTRPLDCTDKRGAVTGFRLHTVVPVKAVCYVS